MIYYWAIFILLGTLTVLNARYAVELYWQNKQLFTFVFYLLFLTALVVIIMYT